MTTEQYSIGYDEGYQAGWNAAMEASPAQRKPLTLEEIKKAMMDAKLHFCGEADLLLARAIEAKLKEKNT